MKISSKDFRVRERDEVNLKKLSLSGREPKPMLIALRISTASLGTIFGLHF